MFHLFVVTPEKVIFDGPVYSINAPGSVGYLEILTNHAPLITILKTGKFTITDESNKKTFFALSGGYLEVSNNQVTVLADAIELASEIDLKRAEAALKKARKEKMNKKKERYRWIDSFLI